MSHYYAKFKENPCVGTDASTPFRFLERYVLRFPTPLPMVYISQLIRSARMCSNVDDFNYRNLFWTAEFLHKAIYIIHLEKH